MIFLGLWTVEKRCATCDEKAEFKACAEGGGKGEEEELSFFEIVRNFVM